MTMIRTPGTEPISCSGKWVMDPRHGSVGVVVPGRAVSDHLGQTQSLMAGTHNREIYMFMAI